MNLESVTEKITQRLARASDLKARILMDFGAQGCLFLDLTRDPALVSHEAGESDVTLSCTLETLSGFLDGTKDPTFAFMTGALKVQGSMGLALKLAGLLEE